MAYSKCAFGRNRHRFAEIQLDLFDWRASPVAHALPSEPLAIRRRYGVPAHVARVIVENACLGGRA